MSPAALAVLLAIAFMTMAVVLNHCHARVALIELTLNEGLPPGHQTADLAATTAAPDLSALLDQGVHVFLSRNCHACQRLLEELGQTKLRTTSALHLHYVDRPRPIANETAEHVGAVLHSHQIELAQRASADPLPYTVAVGAHGLVATAVTPTVPQVVHAARDAGVTISTPDTTESNDFR